MDILILHRVPYPRIEYHRGIDHERHRVTYFGKREILATLPPDLPCIAVERPGTQSAFIEAKAWLSEQPRPVDRVISMSEYELLDAARLRQWLGIEGASIEQVLLTRNKLMMKDAIARAGLRVPGFMPLVELLNGAAAGWSGKTVLKPHSGASSVDIVLFDSPRAAAAAVNTKRSGAAPLDGQSGQAEDFEVEEFVDGPILHFDGLVRHGRILVMSASEYLGTCLGYQQGQPLGSFQIELAETTGDWAARALAAVGIADGSFHLEAIQGRDGLVFLEVGHRVGGADVVATFELATGVHLPSLELRILLGEDTGELAPAPTSGRRWYGWFVYPGHLLQGRPYLGLDGARPVCPDTDIVQWNELALGTPLPRHITYSAHEAPLTGIVATSHPDQSRRWLERLFASVSLQAAQAPAAERVPLDLAKEPAA